MDLLAGVLVFIGGLVAKPSTDLLTELIRELLARRRKNADTANVQADKASERCWEAIAVLNENLLVHVNRKRAHDHGGIPYPESASQAELIGATTAQLGANIELLPVDARAPMRLVVEIVRSVDRIDAESGAPYAHYDLSSTIAVETITYARKVLGAALRRDRIPALPRKLLEYELALQDEEEFWVVDAHPEYHQAHEEARAAWHAEHRDRLK